MVASILMLSVFVSVQLVSAQGTDGAESITMSPTSQEYTIDAGKATSDTFTIYNHGSTAYDFIVYARPYSIANDQYDNPDFNSTKQNTDLYKWVQFPKTKFHVEPNTSVDVAYSVRVPAGTAPGGHYGVIFAEVQPEEKETSGNAVVRKKRVGSIVYTTVNGEVRLAGDVVDDGTIPFWQVQPPLSATVAVQNTGNTHFKNKVQLTVRDILGNVKYRVKKDYQILPSTTRTVEIAWENASWFGLYRVEVEQKFLDKTVKSEGFVLMMPRYIPVALLVIILIGGAYAIKRRYKK